MNASVIAAFAAASISIGCAVVAADAPAPAPETVGVPAAMLAAIRADAAQRAGVDAALVRIGPVQTVTWSDGSLGCPQPGMAYPQVLVPGWRLAVSAGGRTLDYHASRRGGWLWCPAERAMRPLPGNPAI